MQWFKSSLLGKFVVFSSLIALLIAAIAFVLSYQNVALLSPSFLVVSLGLFLLFFIAFFVFSVFRPLRKVLLQMQSLLSGKPYKKIFTDRTDEVGVLAHFFNQVTKSFSSVSGGILERNRMSTDLNVAAQLQRDILPSESPKAAGLEVVAKTKAATEVGGDAYNFLRSGDKVYFYIGDVTGHGVAAGLIMTMVNSLITVFSDYHDSAYEILIRVNRYLKKHVKQAMYMTLVMLCWDEKKQSLSYVGAGHEYILVYRAESGECERLMSGGLALGMVEDNSKMISEKDIPLSPGDFVVLYSDGIVEARNKAGELFGLERLEQLIVEYAASYGPEGVNYHIATDVSVFMGNAEQLDDMTLIVAQRVSKLGDNEDK